MHTAQYHRHLQQQSLHHNNTAPLIQSHYTRDVLLKIKAEQETGNIHNNPTTATIDIIVGRRKRICDETYFLICQSCFWCASYISPQMSNEMVKATLSKCPSCICGDIESIPIAENEEYIFDYDTKRGVIMKFSR